MNKQLLMLIMTSTLLIGCGQKRETPNQDKKEEIVYVDKATLKLNDGSEKELDNTLLSEKEYQLIVDKLTTSILDVKYKFHDELASTNVEGKYANFELIDREGFNSFEYFSFIKEKDEIYQANRLDNRTSSLADIIDYATSEGKLQYGIANISSERYYNDDIPLQMPSVADPKYEEISLDKEFFQTFVYFNSLKKLNYFKIAPSFGYMEYVSPTYGQMKDDFIHSHKLSNKYFILEEKSKGVQVELPPMNDDQKYSYWKSLLDNNYYVKKSFYYDLKTSVLTKIEYDFNTIDPLIKVNTNIKLQLTYDFNLDGYNETIKEIDNTFTKFLAFDGVSKH